MDQVSLMLSSSLGFRDSFNVSSNWKPFPLKVFIYIFQRWSTSCLQWNPGRLIQLRISDISNFDPLPGCTSLLLLEAVQLVPPGQHHHEVLHHLLVVVQLRKLLPDIGVYRAVTWRHVRFLGYAKFNLKNIPIQLTAKLCSLEPLTQIVHNICELIYFTGPNVLSEAGHGVNCIHTRISLGFHVVAGYSQRPAEQRSSTVHCTALHSIGLHCTALYFTALD